MAAIVGIDAGILLATVGDTDFTGGGENPLVADLPVWSAGAWNLKNIWTVLPERNELSLNISVDIAEHKPFVASLSDAWVDKARTWMNWSGSFSGFYDDADDSIFSTMKAGLAKWCVIFDSRLTATASPTDFWFGKVLLTSVDHTTGSEDFSTLDVDFEGLGPLYRSETGYTV